VRRIESTYWYISSQEATWAPLGLVKTCVWLWWWGVEELELEFGGQAYVAALSRPPGSQLRLAASRSPPLGIIGCVGFP
jgi:hypothetical protein